ncbi:hypothetical protein F4778DRAFT_731728 [Xylariomycetidae sp. FL2044]|nr:hypothetical protein F4778DRAFT_731728 [Xylariomycetidae sp. FL2044]
MPPKKGTSLREAERKALAGDNDSEDSQEVFLRNIIEHGIGVSSSSPAPDNCSEPRKARSSKSRLSRNNSTYIPDPQNASNAKTNFNHHANHHANHEHLVAPSSARTHYRPTSPVSKSSASSLAWEPEEVVEVSAPLVQHHAASAVEPPSPLERNDVLPHIPPATAPFVTKGRVMSSQSPTQSNEGRSYDQYNHDDASPMQYTQGSSHHAHQSLHDEDTGFLDFKQCPQIDLPDTQPEESDDAWAPDPPSKSQPTSQVPSPADRYRAPPETPALPQRLFQHGGAGGQVLPPSQLFGQTQNTSAFKKASPTSSRPSPDVFNHNTISPNPVISSPLNRRGLRTSPTHPDVSSPPIFAAHSSRPSDEKLLTSPRRSHEHEVPGPVHSSETPLVPLSKRDGRLSLDPIGEYHPFRKNGTESSHVEPAEDYDDGEESDFGHDEANNRRVRAKIRQGKAEKAISAINPIHPAPGQGQNVVVPSTNKARNRTKPRRSAAEEYIAQCNGKDATDRDESQEDLTVADSQDVAALPAAPQTSDERPRHPEQLVNDQMDDDSGDLPALANIQEPTELKDTIPETSPPSTSVATRPRLVGDLIHRQSSATSGGETVSFPEISSGIGTETEDASAEPVHSSLPEQTSSGRFRSREPKSSAPFARSSPSVIPASSQLAATRRSTRLKHITTPSSTGPELEAPSEPGTATSTLTSLSATPVLSSSTTPNTENEEGRTHDVQHIPSPAARKQRLGKASAASLGNGSPSSLRKLKTYAGRQSLGNTTGRFSRGSSISTDELAKSPSSVSGSETRRSVTRKLTRHSTANQFQAQVSATRHGLFEGMNFAISFQVQQTPKSKEKKKKGKQKKRKDDKGKKEEQRTDKDTIEKLISQEGGCVLPNGFGELFKFDSLPSSTYASAPVLSNSLELLNQETGFTALIADTHSRKVKYMQALALGIPCLSPRWITACISKNEVVDWSSYLLCAGSSPLLGDAIRSRSLQPYAASIARLRDVISQRPQLLRETRILLVLKKTKDGQERLPYVFLAQVLGASFVRVQSIEEARVRLLESQTKGESFDWVYVDDKLSKAQTALFEAVPGDTISRKRKRQSTVTDESDRPPKRVRTLNDELVIQSLILGRLIDEEEAKECEPSDAEEEDEAGI